MISEETFGHLANGRKVERYTLSNSFVTVQVLSYGGIISSIKTPDANGNFGEIVLGFDTLEAYLERSPFFGCITGRFANRIANGQFELEGKRYQLATNDGQQHLHGGIKGFDKQVWQVAIKGESLVLSYTSPDGEEGYPGELKAQVSYTLKDNALELHYEASSSKATPINLTNHTYFNLANQGNILNHELKLAADAYTPTDKGLIPTGELRDVTGTAFDFRQAKPIGQDIAQEDEQLKLAGGYDHNFVLSAEKGLRFAAAARDPLSQKGLECYTTCPGLQVYSGNFLTRFAGRNGQSYDHRSGFCLETQHFPNNINEANFEKSILRPGESYEQTTLFRFPPSPYMFS